jgi:hypothetical protein
MHNEPKTLQLTARELKLLLEHEGIVLDEQELRKDEIRAIKADFRTRFYRSRIVRLLGVSLFIAMVMSVLIFLFKTEVSSELFDYSAVGAVVAFTIAIICIVLPFLFNLIFWTVRLNKIIIYLKYVGWSLIIGLLVGYYYNSIQSDILFNLYEVIKMPNLPSTEVKFSMYILMLLIGFAITILLFLMLKSWLVLKHKKWRFLSIHWMWGEVLMFSIFLGGNVFIVPNSVSYFLNILIIAIFNITTIFRFDKKTFNLYNMHFKDIFQYMPESKDVAMPSNKNL